MYNTHCDCCPDNDYSDWLDDHEEEIINEWVENLTDIEELPIALIVKVKRAMRSDDTLANFMMFNNDNPDFYDYLREVTEWDDLPSHIQESAEERAYDANNESDDDRSDYYFETYNDR
jgi:hypothetical protein